MNAFTDGLGAGIGVGVGFALIDGLLHAQPAAQQPQQQQVVWAGQVNGNTLVVMQVGGWRIAPGFHLYAITPASECVLLGGSGLVPQMLALVQHWQNYLTDGGSVEAWWRGINKWSIPPRMRAVKCSRCNAVQNIPQTDRVYRCWRCKAKHTLRASELASELTGLETNVRCPNCRHVQLVPESQQRFACGKCGKQLKRQNALAEDS